MMQQDDENVIIAVLLTQEINSHETTMAVAFWN